MCILIFLFVLIELKNLGSTTGTLKITGYLRGAPLSVNSLIHIPGLGDYQMQQIDAPFDPFTTNKKSVKTIKILN